LLSRSLAILSVRAVISARVASLMSPLSMLVGKAKVAKEKRVAPHSTETFMFAKTISDVKECGEKMRSKSEKCPVGER
jgi:hypothetical protein